MLAQNAPCCDKIACRASRRIQPLLTLSRTSTCSDSVPPHPHTHPGTLPSCATRGSGRWTASWGSLRRNAERKSPSCKTCLTDAVARQRVACRGLKPKLPSLLPAPLPLHQYSNGKAATRALWCRWCRGVAVSLAQAVRLAAEQPQSARLVCTSSRREPRRSGHRQKGRGATHTASLIPRRSLLTCARCPLLPSLPFAVVHLLSPRVLRLLCGPRVVPVQVTDRQGE